MEKETRGSAVEGPDEREEANREAVGRSMTFTANRKNQAGNTPATRRPYPSAVDCTEMADDYCCQDASQTVSPRLISGSILPFCSPPAIESSAKDFMPTCPSPKFSFLQGLLSSKKQEIFKV